MEQLVFIEKNQAVTDSLIVAETFGKEHRRVMQDVRNLGCSEDFRQHNFVQSTYVNSQNKEMPMYFMNKKGFTLLAMGYTGKEAMKYKEAYINEFERMEAELKSPRVFTEKEQLMASMKLTLETAGEIATVKEDVIEMKSEMKEVRTMVDTQITLHSGEQRRVQKAVSHKIYGIETDPQHRPHLFRELHREVKDRFGVASYKDLMSKELQAALRYIEAWVPKKVY